MPITMTAIAGAAMRTRWMALVGIRRPTIDVMGNDGGRMWGTFMGFVPFAV